MNTSDVATPVTPEDSERSKPEMQMRERPLPDEVLEIDDLIRTTMEADDAIAPESLKDPAVMAQRLDALKGIVWHQEARMRDLETRLDEIHDAESSTLIQRVQSLESNVDLLKRSTADKARRTQETQARNAMRDSNTMQGWSDRQLARAREAVLEALLEGGDRFERMSAAQILEYGDTSLDLPLGNQDIETPDFIVLDALPDLLRRPFMEQFAPVGSLIRDGGLPALSLARHKDWMTFAATFA
ncbi:hypothetical protein B0G57_14118 [Trinickia symbiotica]|nr:hypothetical protein [Trinickia symbiotica]PPK41090.1 hypothetical protein B0G57_14118 [Trinickia symbiotica]